MRTLIVNYSLYLFTIFFISCQLKVEEKTYYEDGSILSKVEMKSNQKNGHAAIYFRNGKIKESGYWIKNKQEGLWKFYYETGTPYADVWFKNGVQHGESIFYYPNKKIMSASNFEFGKGNGELVLYYDNGSTKEISYLKNNKLDSLQILYDTIGREIKRCLYKNGEKVGENNNTNTK